MADIKFHCDDKNNFYDGFSVHAFTYREYSIEMHSHDFYEVNIVLSGKGIHCIENNRASVRTGDVFVIPPMVAHAYTETEGLEVYHILLQKSFVAQNRAESQRVKGFLELTEIEPFLRSNFSNSFFLHLSRYQLVQLKNDLDFLDDGSVFSWEECAAMKYHTVWKIIYWFSRLLNEQINSEKRKSEMKYEVQIIKALEYIHKNYGEKVTIEALCGLTFMSRSTFLRSFKAICGVSPIEYLNNYRCKTAAQQLNSADCSKTEIAHICGFYDLSHMERMLKKYR